MVSPTRKLAVIMFTDIAGYTALSAKDEEKAIEAGKKRTDLLPVVKDHYAGPDRVIDLAIIYILTGEHELALDKFDYLLSIPSWMTK